MRVTPLAVMLSLVFSVGGILLLLALPGPGVDHRRVDRHTGVVLQPPATVLDIALGTGNAVAAAAILAELDDARRGDPDLARALAALAAELDPAPVAAAESHPFRDGAPADPRELAAALARLQRDDDAAAATEELFAAVEPAPRAAVEPVDRIAVSLLDRLDAGERVAAAELVDLARAFDRNGRARARDRWLRRAMILAPDSAAIRLAMARAFVRDGRLHEAAAVTQHVTPPDGLAREWWTLRAELGMWLGRYGDEAAALDELLRDEFDDARTRRLIEVQRAAGRMDLAARIAVRLAAETGRRDDLAAAADDALSAGLTAEGREVLETLVTTAGDPDPWQRRLALVELQDLRFDRARGHLEAVFGRTGDAGDERALEELYRRRRLLGPLTELLLRRWSGAPPPSGSPVELLHLLVALDRREEARGLLRSLAAADLRPAQFARLLPWFVDEGVTGLAGAAETAATRVDRAGLAAFADALAADPAFARALEILAERFPADDAVFRARVSLCWTITDANDGLALARALAAVRPDHEGALRVLAAQAARAGDLAAELRATERVFRLAPGDRDNAVQRAWALGAAGRHAEAASAWQLLVDDGYEPARAPLFDSLIRAGRIEEVARRVADWRLLERDSLLALGDSLWAVGREDLASAAYVAILAADPEHPVALLRAGLLLAGRDPAGALPFLVKRHELGGHDRPEVGFHVGEVLWALGRRREATPYYERAVAGLAGSARRDAEKGAIVARSLRRTGRVAEAVAEYEALLAAHPTSSTLHLDYAELLSETGELRRAEAAIESARRLDGRSRRFLRVQAQHLLRAGEPRDASRAVLRSIAMHRPESTEVADLGTAYEHLGEFGEALATYQRWSALRHPRDSRAAQQRLRDRLASHFALQGHYREIGDDTTSEYAVYGAVTSSERTRIQGRAGHAEYRGRSQAVGAGSVDVVTETPVFDLAVAHRHGPARDQIGGGVRLHPDAPGDRDFAAWLESHWDEPVPAWSLSLRAGFDELWTEPAAAAGLGGRRTGVALSAYGELGERGWSSAELAYARVRARAPGLARVEDDRASANVQVGWRWTDAPIAVADPFRVHRAPAGPESPFLEDGELEGRGLHLSTWAGFTADHVLGDAAITAVLPVSETVHFLYGAARADCRLASGLGVSVDGLVGTDLRGGGSAWELAGALTWRPRYSFECSGRAGVGDAFGRAAFDGDTVFARLEGVLRF